MAIDVFMKVARATAAHSNPIVRENQNELAPRLLQVGIAERELSLPRSYDTLTAMDSAYFIALNRFKWVRENC